MLGGPLEARRGVLVAAAAYGVVGSMFGFAFVLNALAPFFEHDLDLSRDELGLVLGFEFGALFLIAPLAGYLADRVGTRVVTAGAGVLMAIALSGAALSQNFWHVLSAFAIAGFALGACQTPSFAAVQSWFTGRRGLVAGVISTSIGVGAAILTPLGELLAQVLGWRDALLSLAAVSMAVAVLIAPWISSSRDSALAASADKVFKAPAIEIRDLMRSERFLLFAAGSFFMAFALLTPMAHVAVSAVDAGLSVQTAAALVATIGFTSIPARILAGTLADRFGRSAILGWCYAGLGLSFLVWSVAADAKWFFIFSVVYGAFQGACVALRPAATADHFSGPWLGTIMGMIYFASFVGALVGPWIFGHVYETFGSYDYASFGAFGLCLISAVLMWRVARLSVETE
jgi:OFA family oxalate/formate antiporter-like MFS transporter